MSEAGASASSVASMLPGTGVRATLALGPSTSKAALEAATQKAERETKTVTLASQTFPIQTLASTVVGDVGVGRRGNTTAGVDLSPWVYLIFSVWFFLISTYLWDRYYSHVHVFHCWF